MKLITRSNLNSGMVEIYILLPLFFGLVLLVGGIGFLLIHKTRMEKIAWTLQTQGTYRVAVDKPETYQVSGNNFVLDASLDSLTLQANKIDLPKAFRAWIAWYPNRRKTLELKQEFPKVVQDFYLASSLPDEKNPDRMSSGANLETNFTTMGHPLDKSLGAFESRGLKNLIWAEEMKDAGFKYKINFLDFLGYYELIKAGPIPSQVLEYLPGIGNVVGSVLPGMSGPGGSSLPGGIL